MTGSPRPDIIDQASDAPMVAGDEGVFSLPRFEFEGGGQLRDMKVGFVTHGSLNPQRSNAILLAPGTANTRHSADGYIGAGNALDPGKHFIIAFDAIGAGTSSQPADGLGADFPRYTVHDMVRAQHAAIVQGFGLSRLKAVVGASMGAFQALEWAIHFPQKVEAAVLMVPAARSGAVFNAVARTAIEVIALDAHWREGRYVEQPVAGLRAAGRLYYPWTVSDAYLEQLTPEALEHEIRGTIDRASRWDAWNYIRRYQASTRHDVSVPFGGDMQKALACVTARTLVLPASSDRLLGLESAREIARHVPGARYAEVATARGHLGWRAVAGSPETQFITSEITRFLDAEG